MTSENDRGRAVLIHIGYPKTATKWLQRHLFNAAALGVGRVLSVQEVDRLLVFPNGLDFDAAQCRQVLASAVAQVVERGLVPVLSAERLSGLPHSGGWNSKELIDRLAQVLPDGRILLVFREQKAMLYSIYQQYVRSGGQCGLMDYLEPPVRGQGKSPLFDYGHYRYDRLIRYCADRFGRERVLALPFELFGRSPQEFVRRLLRFCGAEASADAIEQLPYANYANRSWSPMALVATRLLNRTLRRGALNPWLPFPLPMRRPSWEGMVRLLDRVPHRIATRVERTMRSAIAVGVAERYRMSNRATGQLVHMDLGALGYDV